MYPPEQLFIYNIDALRAAIANPTESNLFESAIKLRQLLLDDSPLLHQANRNAHLKIRFYINPLGELPIPDADFHLNPDGIAASGWASRDAKEVNLDAFLREPVIKFRGQTATVRELIKYIANYAGAVHKEVPDTPATKALEEMAITYQITDMPSALRCLRGIAKAVVDACVPLYQSLRA